jgi:hypothetical protein
MPVGNDPCDLSTISTSNHGESSPNGQSPQNSATPSDEAHMPRSSDYLRNVASPQSSAITLTTSPSAENWSQGHLTSKKLDQFAETILPSSVQIQLAQTFGKDSVNHSFYAEKCFRHILLPLFKSGFLSCRATKALEKACRRARQLQQLRKKHQNVDFLPLQGFQADWESTTTIREDWKAMTTACLLHFDGDVATMVRWIGGPHVNAHLNVTTILATLQPIVDPDIYSDVERILTLGAPAVCNAEASEANFQAYLKYGNHQSVTKNQSVFESTIVKQSKRGLTLIMDPNMIHFALNAHLSPQGLVDVIHKRRKPRPLSDSSFRPHPGASAINDWTHKDNEPRLHFADSFNRFCVWQWNLAITYPDADRHTGDDDVQCAFPRIKYNPHLVAMHSAISNGTLMMNTGLTFGDNTSPSNWEPIARARQQLAQHLWHDGEAIINQAAKFLPQFTFAPPATPAERAAFAKAIPDTINTGVLDELGNRRPPTYDHHVDDNMYADITELLPRAASASVIALYEIVGYPNGLIPDPISWDKFESTHGHLRRVVGWEFNTRDLTFALPADKRQSITELLATWLNRKSCTLLQAAELHGTLADASRAYRPGRALFFGFQNALRRAIQSRFHQVKAFYNRAKKTKLLSAQLPKDLHTRMDSLIARDIAALLWRTKTAIPIPPSVTHELHQLHQHLADTTRPWSISIGHVVPRDPQFTSLGDACGTGGGAFCHELEYWFDILWSTETRTAFVAGQIHINLLEFVVVLLQLAAAVTRAEEAQPITPMPPLSKLLIRTDNSPSRNWAHKVSARSERGQLFVSLYAALLGRTELTVACNHVAGIDNTLADFISRPPESISHPDRCKQIFLEEPRLRSYHFFRPSAELLSCLASRLFTEQWQESPPLPKSLGRFEIVDYITSCSVTI